MNVVNGVLFQMQIQMLQTWENFILPNSVQTKIFKNRMTHPIKDASFVKK